MSETGKDSPLPWTARGHKVIDEDGACVAEVNTAVGLALIVRTVNSHAQLVAALVESRKSLRGLLGLDDPVYPESMQTLGETLGQVDSALAAAKGDA